METIDKLIGLLYMTGDEGCEHTILCQVLDLEDDELSSVIQSYTSPIFRIRQFGTRYFLMLSSKLNPYIEQLVEKESDKRLTQASMETLAIIAYNQPVTRSDIEVMRGVNSDGPVKTLLEKGLILSKQEETRSQKLYTTDYFLQVFGLKDINALPSDDDTTMQEEMESFFKTMNQKGD